MALILDGTSGLTYTGDSSGAQSLSVPQSVGIGTTSPSARLEVKGSSSDNATININNNSGNIWKLWNDNGASGLNIQYNGSTKVVVDSTGNVIIGGTSTSTNNGSVSTILNVYGGNNVVVGSVSTNVGFGLCLEASRTSRTSSARFAQISLASDASDNGSIYFYTAPAGSGVSERMRIDSTGLQSYNIAGFAFTQFSGVYTPTGKTRVTYVATGAQQTFVVPAGITNIFVKLWGAGSGGGMSGGWSFGSPGGGGGHSYGIIPVTPLATYYIVVGAAGQTTYASTTTLGYGGGGGLSTNTDNRWASSGGGYTGIFNNVTPSQGAALLIAGGAGGGGASRQGYGNGGGAGGGSTGQQGGSPYDAKSAYGGGGGTQSAGGVAGTGSNAGGALFGGAGGNANAYGGGGGGGYWGGGGGSYSESNTMAGGGGGSGFVGSTVLMGATFTGAGQIPAFSFDNDLSKSVDTYRGCMPYAYGGHINQIATVNVANTYGGSGYVVIYY